MELTRWAAKGSNFGVHIVETMPWEYQAIIGCHLLGRVGARVRNISQGCGVRIGEILYSCEEFLSTIRTRIEAINRYLYWRLVLKREFKEGDICGVTGKTVYEILLNKKK